MSYLVGFPWAFLIIFSWGFFLSMSVEVDKSFLSLVCYNNSTSLMNFSSCSCLHFLKEKKVRLIRHTCTVLLDLSVCLILFHVLSNCSLMPFSLQQLFFTQPCHLYFSSTEQVNNNLNIATTLSFCFLITI